MPRQSHATLKYQMVRGGLLKLTPASNFWSCFRNTINHWASPL